MGRYKRYLYSGEAVPKTTRNRRKIVEQPLISHKRKKHTDLQNPTAHCQSRDTNNSSHLNDSMNHVSSNTSEAEMTQIHYNEAEYEARDISREGFVNEVNHDSDSSVETNQNSGHLNDSMEHVSKRSFQQAEKTGTIYCNVTENEARGVNGDSSENEVDYVSDTYIETDMDETVPKTSDEFPTEIASEDLFGDSYFTEYAEDTHGNDNSEDSKADMFEKICSCTSTTVGEVLVMCLTLGLRHNLPWIAQTNILKMLNFIHQRAVIPATKFSFLSQVEKCKDSILYHIFCSECDMYHGNRKDLKEIVNCLCGNIIDVSKTTSFFLSLSLESQLKEILLDPEIAKSIMTYRFQRAKIQREALEDIYDGTEYQRLFVNGGVLSTPHNFSYCFNTDGIPLGKSSNKTIWPIYLTLNELPPKDRSKYTLLAGIYVGNKDPNQKVFLQPFVNAANSLSTKGFDWSFEGKVINSKLIPLCAVVDSVARWQVLNMSSFNANQGCTFCYQKTERTIKERRYSVGLTKPVQRTAESTKRDALEAYSMSGEKNYKKRVVKGVKGPTPLMLMYFNLITGFVPDYMHALLLGVIRLHTELILESTRKKFWVDMTDSIGVDHLLTAIQERISKIKPPKSITRLPRSLKEAKIWKASEWRSWLIFYCVPCLNGFLKEKHILHLSLLSSATNIILQKSVTREEVCYAHNLFMRYAILFEKYLGTECMVFNVHLLTHICQGVLSFGPAWTHNAFLYEGQNRHLLQLYQSPSQVALQIVRKFLIFNALPSLCVKFSASQKTLKYCEEIVDKKLKHYVRHSNTVLIGQGKKTDLSNEEKEVLLTEYELASFETISFKKMFHKGMRLTVFDYTLNHKNNDAFVVIKDQNEVFRIEKILQSSRTGEVLLLGRNVIFDGSFKIGGDGFNLTHIKKVEKLGNLCGISVENIQTQCVFMNVGTCSYVCSMPYGCYGD